jgi:hypothetical protein
LKLRLEVLRSDSLQTTRCNCHQQLRNAFRLETRIDWFCFKGENTEDAFVNAAKRFATNEAFERLNAESEFAKREGAFATETTGS